MRCEIALFRDDEGVFVHIDAAPQRPARWRQPCAARSQRWHMARDTPTDTQPATRA
ncbi:hypothetical protein [Rhodovulum sp. MB263]|uniref:hypothetical protein n=1 Tax=Rhodovulum sp. (strain MB263) TaxID=308754 RepID=UPI0018C8BE3B|nr:hypothetical protein [Rhodovulum sp. MB263]